MLFPFLKIKRLLAAIMFLVTICFCSCSKDKLAGREFDGYYHDCERISLNFEADSNVVATISSTDFVGHFSDHVYGHYEFNHPNIIITWTGADPDNDAYKDVMANPDRVLINESLDTLWLYEKNEKFVLPKYHLYHIDKDAPLLEQIGQYCGQTELLIVIFIVNHFFSLVVAIIIFVLFMKWWKKRKK